uniref:Carbonic anhydrase n=1 Tax=Cynoglossus semilaevis TaxID=244447 RepID=A0A3P8VXM8_CYNSE
WHLHLQIHFSCSPLSSSVSDWCYQSQYTCNNTCTGPARWGKVSEHCDGRTQSPVNIVRKRVLPDGRLTPFQLSDYLHRFRGHLVNNGHSVQLDLPSHIKISGGNLPVTYKALQLHLHWGKHGGPGSEHLIDGEQFPMEIHIVHLKEKYHSLSEALKDRAGLAVLGFFFQESESENKNFSPIINALEDIIQPYNSTMLDLSLAELIPDFKSLNEYFRYDGSLTTPSCAEAVVWTVFEHTIPLSRNQLSAFSKLKFSDGQPMINSYRPVQPLNGRQVYYSRGHLATTSNMLILLAALVTYSTL